MSEIKRKIERIEMQIGAKPGNEKIIDYGEYVRAVKSIIGEMEKGKKLEDVLKRSAYGKTLKEVLRKSVPRLLAKIREEMSESEK